MSKIVQRFLVGLVAVIALVAAAFVAAQPATATPRLAMYPGTGWGYCPSKNASGVTIIGCLYSETSGQGTVYMMGPDFGCRNQTGLVNQVSSVLSQSWSTYTVSLYPNANCTGTPMTLDLDPGDRISLPLGPISLQDNDMESWKITISGIDYDSMCS